MYVSHAVSTRKEKLQGAVKYKMLRKQNVQRKKKAMSRERKLDQECATKCERGKESSPKKKGKILDLLLAARQITQKHLHLCQDT